MAKNAAKEERITRTSRIDVGVMDGMKIARVGEEVVSWWDQATGIPTVVWVR